MSQVNEGNGPKTYVPAEYKAHEPAAIVRKWPFALVVSPQLYATSTPLFFEHDESHATLVGHFARRGGHASAITLGQEVLATFMGPHAYISPRWYVEKPEVPTWNYVATYVRGQIEPIDDDQGQIAVLRRTAACLEAGADNPWTLEGAPAGRVAVLLPMIRSFRIHIRSIDGVTKLSQRHPANDRARVAAALAATEEGGPLARLMMDAGWP